MSRKVECKDLALTLGVWRSQKISVPANSIVAVVGPAASEKQLFLSYSGFYGKHSGSVLIDGRSLLSLDLKLPFTVSMVTANLVSLEQLKI